MLRYAEIFLSSREISLVFSVQILTEPKILKFFLSFWAIN